MILPDDTPPSPSKLRPATLPVERAAPTDHQSQPPPAYPGTGTGYPSYQAAQPIYPEPSSSTIPLRGIPSEESLEYRKIARRRFLKALLVAVIIYLAVFSFFGSIIRLSSRHGRWIDIDIPSQRPRIIFPNDPLPEDGKLHRCVTGPIGWEQKKSLRIASFDLPLSSDALYLFTRGSGLSGNVVIKQDENQSVNDTVHIEVGVPSISSDRLGSLKICSLERKRNQYGIGIFSNPWYSDTHPSFELMVTVRVPRLDQRKALHISSFETNMPIFSHTLDVGTDVSFGSLALKTSNERIVIVGGLQAYNASLQTSNAGIEGVFSTEGSLELVTSNHPIEAAVTLHNSDESRPTRLRLQTVNARLNSNVYLLSDDNTGGKFDVTAQTTNALLSRSFGSQPIDSDLHLRAISRNSLSSVYLHRAYEGDFSVQSTNARQILEVDEHAESPHGDPGIVRKVQVRKFKNSFEGSVVWARRDEAPREGKGKVEVITTNSPALLKLL